jgi:hypothetical protein
MLESQKILRGICFGLEALRRNLEKSEGRFGRLSRLVNASVSEACNRLRSSCAINMGMTLLRLRLLGTMIFLSCWEVGEFCRDKF